MSSERNLTLDVLKLVLAFAVVGLHVRLLQDFNPHLGYLLVNGLFRIAVPSFLIINGYFLYDAIQAGRVAGWLRRVLQLYLFWMVVYAPIWAFEPGVDLGKLVVRVVFGYHHLWYIVGIFGGGALIWAIRRLRPTARFAFALAAFVGGVFVQYAGAYHWMPEPLDALFGRNWAHRNFLLMGFPFMYFGYLLREGKWEQHVPVGWLWTGTAFGLALLCLEAWFNQMKGVGAQGFDNLISLALACPCAFMLALRSKRATDLRWMTMASAGIYFTHPLFIYLLGPRLPSSASLFAVVSVLSLLTALLLSRFAARFRFVL